MRITKRQLRNLMREAMTSFQKEIGTPSEFDESGWGPWLKERGLKVDDLDALAHIVGAPDRSWLGAKPPANNQMGPVDLDDAASQISAEKMKGTPGLSQEVPTMTPARKSSWQARKEKEMGESRLRITKGQLKRIIKEVSGSDIPEGDVIGYIEANIDGDYRYNQQLSVIHDSNTDEVHIIVQDAGAVGGMDYQGPGEGRTPYHTVGRQLLPAGAKGKDLAAAIKTLIQRKADTIKQYGKPSKNFVWGQSMHSSGPKGLNVKLATMALRKARGLEEGTGLRITKRQLYRIIREAMDVVNAESGEVFEFGEEGLPDAAWPDLQKRLGLTASRHSDGYFEVNDADFNKLTDEVEGKQGQRKSAADAKRLNPSALRDRLDKWAEDAGYQYLADNPGTDVQDIARDLADSAEYQFEQDEWDALIDDFDYNEDALLGYIADAIASMN